MLPGIPIGYSNTYFWVFFKRGIRLSLFMYPKPYHYMKKLLFSALFIALAITAFAQKLKLLLLITILITAPKLSQPKLLGIIVIVKMATRNL
jgi:hypothetical protein